jgi:hypothetical protein
MKDKLVDFRFLAPPGIMILVVSLFSPKEFGDLVKSISSESWAFGLFGLLGVGFVISSVTQFFVTIFKAAVPRHKYKLMKIFETDQMIKNTLSARELATWMTMDKEKSLHIQEQIHKRWSMAMANYNVAVAIIFGGILALILKHFNIYRSIEDNQKTALWISLLLLFFFIFNGVRANMSVLKMDELLAIKHKN